MSHRRLTAFMLAAALLGAGAWECADPGGVDVRRPPGDQNRVPQPATQKTAVITARIFKLPGEIEVDVYNIDTGGEESYGPHQITTEVEFQQTVVYDTGVRLRVSIIVNPAKYDEKAYCQIVDGVNRTIAYGKDRPSRIFECSLATSQ